MKNLIQEIDENTGGLELVFVTEWENIDFTQFPLLDGLKLVGNLILKPGKLWYRVLFTRHADQFEQTLKTDRHGEIFQHSLKGSIPKDTPELGAELADLMRRRLVILFKDRNGYLRLCTTSESWLEFTYKLSTGKNPADGNGYDLAFAGESTEPAYYYSGSFEVSEIGIIEPVQTGGGSGEPVTIKDGAGNVRAVVQPGQTFIITSGFSWGFNII